MRCPYCHSTSNKVIDSRPSREAEEALDQAGITVNKNAIPFDQRSPRTTSGTPALTTRGMKEPEMEIIAGFIHPALSATTGAAASGNWQARRKSFAEVIHFLPRNGLGSLSSFTFVPQFPQSLWRKRPATLAQATAMGKSAYVVAVYIFLLRRVK